MCRFRRIMNDPLPALIFLLLTTTTSSLCAGNALQLLNNTLHTFSVENSRHYNALSVANVEQTRSMFLQHLAAHGYNRLIAPNFENATFVNISYWFGNLRSFDEHDETLHLPIQFYLSWHDERLRIVGLNETLNIFFTGDGEESPPIWVPPMYIRERKSRDGEPLLNYKQTTVELSTGFVNHSGMFVDDLHCLVSTRAFPFDTQSCGITFYTWGHVNWTYDARQLNMMRHDLETQNEDEIKWRYEVASWKLAIDESGLLDQYYGNIEIRCNFNNNGRCYLFTQAEMRRKPAQFIFPWIVTPILLSVSSVVGMYGGCDHVERFSFGGAVVVTLTLMHTELRQVLAVGIDGTPIVAIMYMGLTACMIVATLTSAVPEYLAHELLPTHVKLSLRQLNGLVMGVHLVLQAVVIVVAAVMWLQVVTITA